MPKAITQDSNGLGYPVSIYYLYVNNEEAYEVYAVSVEDAFECLFENEPKVTFDDIILHSSAFFLEGKSLRCSSGQGVSINV